MRRSEWLSDLRDWGTFRDNDGMKSALRDLCSARTEEETRAAWRRAENEIATTEWHEIAKDRSWLIRHLVMSMAGMIRDAQVEVRETWDSALKRCDEVEAASRDALQLSARCDAAERQASELLRLHGDAIAREQRIQKNQRRGPARRLGHLSAKTRFHVFVRDGFVCVWCGRSVNNGVELSAVKATVDHVVPVSKGGSDEMDNLVTACAECNAGKSNRYDGRPAAAASG